MSFNLADVHEAVSAANPDRLCVVWRDRRLTYAEITDRSRRFATALADRGFGTHIERDKLRGHESGQDHLALYLHNGNEYIEAMLGAFKARVVPFNVNYRYVEEELQYLLSDAKPPIIMYHAAFAPQVAAVLDRISYVELLIQVADDSGNELLPGALEYETLLAESPPELPDVGRTADDLYMIYTGGTTGMPKGVLWRQHDVFVAAMGGHPWGHPEPFSNIDQVVAASLDGGAAMMTAAPLMHGAAQWLAFTAFTGGHTLVLPDSVDRFDPAEVWSTIEREHVLTVQIVGDAFGRPLVEELEANKYDLSNFMVISNGGAPLHASIKDRLFEKAPHVMVIDAVGSSETGGQMGDTVTKDGAATGSFQPGDGTVVVDESLATVLAPGDVSAGWLAQRGHIPLGYLGDADKTARTFTTIDGIRYAVPGDRAVWRSDGRIEFSGRDSATINSGGEKIYAEEVERAVLHHPAVLDVMVVGRPSEKWGSEVVALVQLGRDATDDEILSAAATHIARYKLPKAVLRRPSLERSPAGKANYRWATEQAREHHE